LAKRAMPDYNGKFSKKTFTQPQWLACLILKLYLRQTNREAEAGQVVANSVRGWLNLRQIPEHWTLCRLFHHKVADWLLGHLLALSLPPCNPRLCRQRIMAVDSTGFEAARCSRYYRWHTQRQRQRGWPKMGDPQSGCRSN